MSKTSMFGRGADLRGIAVIVVAINFVLWSFRFWAKGDGFWTGVLLGAISFGVVYVALAETFLDEAPKMTEKEGDL